MSAELVVGLKYMETCFCCLAASPLSFSVHYLESPKSLLNIHCLHMNGNVRYQNQRGELWGARMEPECWTFRTGIIILICVCM